MFSFTSIEFKKYCLTAASVISCLAGLLIFSPDASAQGDLLITPRRVVFENGKRSEELNLANTGKDTATYVISLIEIRMKEDGDFEKINTPDSAQRFADKNLRIFPRTVTLAPNEAQTVKVQVSKSGELETGEYRSHLYFRAVPRDPPLGDKKVTNDTTISVHIVPIFGISMPVIIRVGDCSAKVFLSDIALQVQKDTIPVLKLSFNRTGNMSLYGDLSVEHISDLGKVTKVGIVRGIAVYAPNSKRNFHLLLDNNAGVNYHQGKLRIIYYDQSTKAVKLAEEEVALK